jgi:hypothetical protein
MNGTLKPRLNIAEAISWFTGGAYNPSLENLKWGQLHKQLEKHNFTGFEYCVFMLYYQTQYPAHRNDVVYLQRPDLLSQRDLFEEFLEHKKHSKAMAKAEQRHARRTFRNNVAAGLTVQQIIDIPGIHLNSIAYIEEALRACVEEDFDPSTVYEQNRKGALVRLLGTPEYLLYSPYLFNTLKQEDMNAFKFFNIDV